MFAPALFASAPQLPPFQVILPPLKARKALVLPNWMRPPSQLLFVVNCGLPVAAPLTVRLP
jgi:hypothetical protein